MFTLKFGPFVCSPVTIGSNSVFFWGGSYKHRSLARKSQYVPIGNKINLHAWSIFFPWMVDFSLS